MSSIAIPTQPRRVLADVIPRSLLAEVALVVGAAALVGALAQISIHLSFTPVPITGQTLGVMLAGSALGWRRAGAAMLSYTWATWWPTVRGDRNSCAAICLFVSPRATRHRTSTSRSLSPHGAAARGAP